MLGFAGERPLLIFITDTSRTEEETERLTEAVIRGGVNWIHLRDKNASAAKLYRTALLLRRVTAREGALFSVNDRIDVALAAGADGVHLGGESLPPDVVRKLLPPGRLVGVSVHSVTEAEAAEKGGADYVFFGHVFATSSKPGLPPRGIETLKEVVDAVHIPVFAIGGIKAENVFLTLQAGAKGVAVIGALRDSSKPEEAARELRRALDN